MTFPEGEKVLAMWKKFELNSKLLQINVNKYFV